MNNIILLIFWIAIFVFDLFFWQNGHLFAEELEEDENKDDFYFDPLYFLTWLFGAILILTRIIEFY